MNALVDYLMANADDLIGRPIAPTAEVLSREDAALYIWQKMGMSHETLQAAIPDRKQLLKLAPAAHLYVLNRDELQTINQALNRLYDALYEALDGVEGLWYMANLEDGWHLFNNLDDLGLIEEEGPGMSDTDLFMSRFIRKFRTNFPVILSLTECLVFPFGNRDRDVWEYAGMVSLLGANEAMDFINGVVTPYTNGGRPGRVVPRWGESPDEN